MAVVWACDSCIRRLVSSRGRCVSQAGLLPPPNMPPRSWSSSSSEGLIFAWLWLAVQASGSPLLSCQQLGKLDLQQHVSLSSLSADSWTGICPAATSSEPQLSSACLSMSAHLESSSASRHI